MASWTAVSDKAIWRIHLHLGFYRVFVGANLFVSGRQWTFNLGVPGVHLQFLWCRK